MSVEERRATIAAVIDCVFVRPGKAGYDRRISIAPTGTAPNTLPRKGEQHATIRGYPHQREWLRPNHRPLDRSRRTHELAERRAERRRERTTR
jgi:hypothetical protein